MKSINLTIGGEERTFHFGLYALGTLLANENIQISELQLKIAENYYKWCPLVMYHCLAYGYIRKGEFAPFDVFDVAEWIDELTEFETQEVIIPDPESGENKKVDVKIQKVVKDFFTAFWKSVNENVPQQEEDKKKVTKK